MCVYILIYIYIYVYPENRTNGKRHLSFDCCKMKTEKVENFRLFPEKGNGKWKFVFLGRQTINGNYICYFSKRAHR